MMPLDHMDGVFGIMGRRCRSGITTFSNASGGWRSLFGKCLNRGRSECDSLRLLRAGSTVRVRRLVVDKWPPAAGVLKRQPSSSGKERRRDIFQGKIYGIGIYSVKR